MSSGPGGGYEVELEALEKAAAAYTRQGSAVHQYLEEFLSKANLPDKAFGNLPQCGQLAAQYQKFLEQVRTDMGKLSESLTSGGKRMGASAANYRNAESASTIH
jgi:uncharacterized protein YukE